MPEPVRHAGSFRHPGPDGQCRSFSSGTLDLLYFFCLHFRPLCLRFLPFLSFRVSLLLQQIVSGMLQYVSLPVHVDLLEARPDTRDSRVSTRTFRAVAS